MLVLEVEERICGFAVARSVLDEAELMLIAVPQKMRGRGYGRALLDKVIVECRRRNVRRIYLEVRSDNENAVMLYESAGFRPVGRRCGYYRGKDAVWRDERSEERRVGKECGSTCTSRGSAYLKK